MPSFPLLQLLLIRIYVGLDFIPHFSEKLFEGPGPRGEDIAAFKAMGIANPGFMVILAGLIELAACIGLTLGIWTRLAGLGAAVYLLFALFMGGHDKIGFIWVLPGGGWEFAAFWAFICASFVLTGGGKWSVDALLRNWEAWPGWLRRLSA